MASVASNKTAAQEFEDIVVPLQENRALSLMADENVRRSYGSRSRSFITPQDVGSEGQSPGSQGKRRMLSRSVSSLGESMMGLNEAIDEDEFLLSNEYLQGSAYDCLLMSNHQALANPAGNDSMMETIESLRMRLDISEAAHELSSLALKAALERTQGKVPVRSAIFRLCLIESLVLQRAGKEAGDETRLLPELRHLSVFACAMQFAVRRLHLVGVLTEAHANRLSSQLSHDIRKLRSRIVVFTRSPTTENADAMRALIAGTLVRYTQFPFAEAGGQHPPAEPPAAPPPSSTAGSARNGVGVSPDVALPEEAEFIPATRRAMCGNLSSEDLVLTENEGVADMCMLAVLNVSGEVEDDHAVLSNRSPSLANEPRSVAEAAHPAASLEAAAAAAGRCVGYTFPLNAMLYATLFHTFFGPEEGKPGEKKAAVQSTAQRRKHGIHRSRRQDLRLKNVVDVLASVRTTFGITEFLHASCFIHVVLTENVEGTLTVTEMYKLLSVDCYYYPGFKQYCKVPASTLSPEEQLCRTQVLTNMRDEFSMKLSDYHAELASSPEDLVYISKLLTTILQFDGEAGDLTSPLSTRSQDRGNGRPSAPVPGELDPLSPTSTVPQGRSSRMQPSPVSSVQSPRTDDRAGTRLSEDWERRLECCISDIGAAMGEDVAALAGEVMGGKCPEEVASGQLSLSTYCELVGLVVSSAVKHYIRVKHKVRSSRADKTDVQASKNQESWLDHLSASGKMRSRTSVNPVSQSVSSLTADVGRSNRTGAARLAPGSVLPPRPAPTVTLQRINANFRLTIDQVRHLLEVLLLEVHADTSFYTSSLVGVLPSAVPIVLAVYSKLLADDVNTTLESLQPLRSLPLSVGESSLGFIDVAMGLSMQSAPPAPFPSPPPDDTLGTSPQRARRSPDLPRAATSTPVGGYSSSPPNSGRAPSRVPPPPRRSSSPPMPLGGSARRCKSTSLEVRASNSGGVPLDDIVAVSMLVTNLVYTVLLLELLQANFRQYVSTQQRYPTPDSSPLALDGFDVGSPLPTSPHDGDRPDLQHSRSAQLIRHKVTPERRPESVGSPVQFRTYPPLGPRKASDVVSSVAVAPDSVLHWDQVDHEREWSMSAGPEELSDEILNPVQASLLRKWRTLVEATLDLHVKKVVAVDDFSPVGTAQESGVSSSAVDLVSMSNRIAVLVTHGIENAWEALKLSRAGAGGSDVASPRQPPDDYLCQYFSNNCEAAVSRFEDECRSVLNMSFRRYADLMAQPLQEVDWNACIADYRVLRVKHGDFFRSESHTSANTALRANNILFCRLRMNDLHLTTISRYHLVAWKAVVGEPHIEVPLDVKSDPRSENGNGFPEPLTGAAAAAVATGSTKSPSESSMVSCNTRQAATVLEEASSIVYKTTLRALLGFLAAKVVFFELYTELRGIYTNYTVSMRDLLRTLSAKLVATSEFLVPHHRPAFARDVLQRLVAVLSWKVMRGKQVVCEPPPENGPDTHSDLASHYSNQQHGAANPFHRYMEDLKLLRDFFQCTGGALTAPAPLTAGEVEGACTPLLDAMLLHLTKYPTELLLTQGCSDRHHSYQVSYTTAQLYGMWVQTTDDDVLAHNYLTEYLARRREDELEATWDEQRARIGAADGASIATANDESPSVAVVSSAPRDGARPLASETSGKAQDTDKEEGQKKGQTSRTCAVQ